MVPGALAGPGRRAAWRRTRLRRGLAALLAGLAAWSVAGAYLPHPAAVGEPVQVAARDLPAGAVLSAADLTMVRWPRDLVPPHAVTSMASLVGRAVGSPVGRGEVLTTTRLSGPGLLTGLADGQIAFHLVIGDPAMTALLRPGDRVDVLATGSGEVVGHDLLVLAADPSPGSQGSAWETAVPVTAAPGVLLAVTEAQASALARSLARSDVTAAPLTVALRADAPGSGNDASGSGKDASGSPPQP